MNNKTRRIIICLLFCSLILNTTVFFPTIVKAIENEMIGDISDYARDNGHITSTNFVVDSDENFYVIFFNNSSPYNFTLWKSTNQGTSWSSSLLFDMSDDYDMQPDFVSTYIDDTDKIHIAYLYGDGTGYNISYRQYNTNTGVTSAKTHVKGRGNGYYARSLCILVNDDGERGIFFSDYYDSAPDVADLSGVIYNDQTEVWGDIKEITTHNGSPSYYRGLSGDVMTNGSFVLGYIKYRGGDYNKAVIEYFDDETDYSEVLFSRTIQQDNGLYTCDLAIDTNGDMHFVYGATTSRIDYTFYDISEDTADNESMAESTASNHPQIALNKDNTVQIVFIGDNGVTPSDWVMGYYGSYGSWSDLQYYNQGATGNSDFVILPYQGLQSFTKSTDGVVGIAINETDDILYYFSEGYELFNDPPDPAEPDPPTCEWEIVTEWENLAVGTQSGIDEWFSFEARKQGGGWENDSTNWGIKNNWAHNGSKSFYVKCRSNVNPHYEPDGYWNLTKSYDYIERFDFWFEFGGGFNDAYGTDERIWLRFYNADDEEVMRLEFNAADDLRYYEVGSGWDTLHGTLESIPSDTGHLVITHNETNQMDYALYNITNDLIVQETGSSYIAEDWEGFSYILIDSEEGGNGAVAVYFDDFRIYECTPPPSYVPPVDDDVPWDTPDPDEWGYVTVGLVMNESAPWEAIEPFDLLVSDYQGTYTYFCDECEANQSINISILPWGYDVVFQVSADNYQQRTYYKDINPFNDYTFNFYLPPVVAPTYNGTGDDGGNTTTSKVYFVQTVDEGSNPIAGAKVTLKRYMNYTSSWQEVGSMVTGGYGYGSLYLRPNVLYKAYANATGYQNVTSDWITDINYHGLTYPLIIQMPLIEDDFDDYHFDDWVSWTAEIGGSTLYVNYTDLSNRTTDWTITIWESNHSTGTFTNYSWNRSTTATDSYSIAVNTSNTYYVYMFLNHSIFGHLKFQKTFAGNYTPVITPDEFENIFDKILKYNPFGWSNFVMFIVLCLGFFNTEPRDLGWVLVLIGGFFFFINFLIGFNTAFVTYAGAVIPILVILGGILILWDDSRKYGYYGR